MGHEAPTSGLAAPCPQHSFPEPVRSGLCLCSPDDKRDKQRRQNGVDRDNRRGEASGVRCFRADIGNENVATRQIAPLMVFQAKGSSSTTTTTSGIQFPHRRQMRAARVANRNARESTRMFPVMGRARHAAVPDDPCKHQPTPPSPAERFSTISFTALPQAQYAGALADSVDAPGGGAGRTQPLLWGHRISTLPTSGPRTRHSPFISAGRIALPRGSGCTPSTDSQ